MFFINNIKIIIIKNIMHLLDLLQFIFIIFIQIENDKELDQKIYFPSFINFLVKCPPYQRKDHGRRLLTVTFNNLQKDSRIQDIKDILKFR